MASAGVVRIGLHYRVEMRENRPRPRPHRAVGMPVVPWAEIHERIDVQRPRLDVAWMLGHDSAHGAHVRRVLTRPTRRIRRRVPRDERIDQVDFRGIGGTQLSAFRHDQGALGGDARHRRVDVRTIGERDAERTHRTGGVEPLRFAKRADRFGMIERPEQPESLIEVPLCFGRGIDGVVVMPEVFLQLRALRPGRCRRRHHGLESNQDQGQLYEPHHSSRRLIAHASLDALTLFLRNRSLPPDRVCDDRHTRSRHSASFPRQRGR